MAGGWRTTVMHARTHAHTRNEELGDDAYWLASGSRMGQRHAGANYSVTEARTNILYDIHQFFYLLCKCCCSVASYAHAVG